MIAGSAVLVPVVVDPAAVPGVREDIADGRGVRLPAVPRREPGLEPPGGNAFEAVPGVEPGEDLPNMRDFGVDDPASDGVAHETGAERRLSRLRPGLRGEDLAFALDLSFHRVELSQQ